MHFVSTRVGRWDVDDDYDDDVDDNEDYDDDIGAQVSEYDDYEYELRKEGLSEERTDGAYISVKSYLIFVTYGICGEQIFHAETFQI